MEICPVDRPWIHTYILEPYLEGCELINQAWNGIDWSLERNPLSLMDRVVCFIKGALLMIPLINTIVWIAWQTLGHPERMSAPFCPEENSPPSLIFSRRPLQVQQRQDTPKEQFVYQEESGGNQFQVSWLVEKMSDKIIVTQDASTFFTISIYSPDYRIQELHYTYGSKKIDLVTTNPSEVHVTISDGENCTSASLAIPQDGLPLIQQRIGFRPFVLSEAQEIEFYALIPEYPFGGFILNCFRATPFIAKVKATKMGVENGLVKVKVVSAEGWPYNLTTSELWFDPRTGVLQKFRDSGLISEKTGTLVPNDLPSE